MCQTLLPTSLYVHTVNSPHEEAGHREVKAFTQDTLANEGLGPRQSGSRASLLNNASEPDRPSLGFRSFHQALGCQAPARERETEREQRSGRVRPHLPGRAKRPQAAPQVTTRRRADPTGVPLDTPARSPHPPGGSRRRPRRPGSSRQVESR